MTVDLKTVLLNYKGEPIKVLDANKEGDQEEKDLTLKDVFAVALNTIVDNESQTAELKNKIFQLSVKVYAGDDVELTVDDAAFIKERVGKVYNSLVYGRTCEVLDKP